MYSKIIALKDKLQKLKENRKNRQSDQTFHFSPFSKKQKQVLTWWCRGSPVHDKTGIIADGAIRSGKTISMSLSFVMWAMSSFSGQNFAMCGKTIGSFRRNVLFWLKLMLRSRGYSITDHRADNLLTIRKDGRENYFYIFGGKDERSQDLIQGITLAGVFFDEVALMPESFVNQARAVGTCWTNRAYAPYVEFGTGPKGQANHAGISPEVTPVYTQVPWWIHESQVDRRTAEKYRWFYINTPQGRFYQCTGQPAHPFLYPALHDNEDKILKNMKASFQADMNNATADF